jgi:hypothetical protein
MIQGLVLSVGMPRAGSGWHYNLIHDLILAGGGQDARQIRQRYHLQRFLTEVNCNIGTLSAYRLLPVLLPSLLGNTYAVKTHAGPTSTARWLMWGKRMTPVYIYRDPRAALLSAYEVGQKAVEKGRSNAFSSLTSLDRAADFVQQYVHIWEHWMGIPGVLVVRYEDLVDYYNPEGQRLAKYLDLSLEEERVKAALEKYRPERGESGRRGTHFSQGKAERFRRVFTAEQLEQFTSYFSGSLEQMGYPA